MRLLAFASAALTAALFLAFANTKTHSATALATSLLAIVSALAFLLALVPPSVVRMVWRRPEQQRVQDAIRDLVTLARSQHEVAARVLAPMADIVGARGLAIRNEAGRVLGAHNLPEAAVEELERGERPGLPEAEVFDVEIPSGSLVVWTSRYAPFFGNDELRVLNTLGALTGLALDRVRLFQQEHEVRLALEQADEVKTNFIALASHELRTPVTTIHGLAATLSRHGDRLDEEQRVELRTTIERQAARLATLVEQLLDLSRLDADAIPIEPEQFNVKERLCEIVATVAPERPQDVQVSAPDDLEACADPSAIDRIVTNLVTNALRYGAPPVSVTAAQTDRHFRIAVEDRGEGVPPKFVPDLFERFSRESGSRERARGTGLGLAIARSYARAHRGDLVYEDAEPNGARFNLVLPTEDVEAHRRAFATRR
jgi:signal transduction histidine kinase